MERIIKKNILFLTAVRILDPEEKGIYTDLLRKFRDEGFNVYVVCPEERRYGGITRMESISNINILYVKSLNLQKTGLVEKGLATLSLSWLLYRGIKKYFKNVNFDLLLYSTPPITYNKSVSYLKKRDQALTYLLLKDIFPQNAVDLSMIKKDGLVHRYFQKVENKLYHLSDFIGCMSEANKSYILKNHPYLHASQVEVNPNSIDLKWLNNSKPSSTEFRKKWGINSDALICLYGGNLGKPQGIDFLIDILEHYKNDPRLFFFIIGDGTEFNKLSNWFLRVTPHNAKLIKHLPKSEFDEIAKYGDAGLILLDKRFTIPNFPSRLLTYLENKMSIWAATDLNTDIGKLVNENKFGFWVESGDIVSFVSNVEKEIINSNVVINRGKSGFNFLKENFNVNISFKKVQIKLP
ncbi:MAG: glycosyltransferase family 4 protein [Bacteroidetes bacterium]|nr:glycosyltransferase family 4 protein [Bacteroidota bacterium]